MQKSALLFFLLLWVGCGNTGNPQKDSNCDDEGALASCLSPTQSEAYYVEQAHSYFDTMDREPVTEIAPAYSERVARWEWPPWLKLTGYEREPMTAADALLQLYPSVIPERDCRAFSTQPFARCYVTFYYDAHEGNSCPIYEEFTFNDQGEMTFIEAWSDLAEFLPMGDANDTWAEGEDVHRLSAKIPGLGNGLGLIDLKSTWMETAAQSDLEIEDFVLRATNWYDTWLAEVAAAGDDMWDRGCGWQ